MLGPPVGITAIDSALDHLSQAAPGVKRRVVEACAFCIAADGIVQTEEGELLRAITTALDCPLPPFLAEHPAGTAAGLITEFENSLLLFGSGRVQILHRLVVFAGQIVVLGDSVIAFVRHPLDLLPACLSTA